MRLAVRRAVFGGALLAVVAAGWAAVAPGQRAGDASFAARIAALSEPGGYFDTDNLISNERSYLHPIPELEAAGVRGGAYIGVGPDQNFTYMAHVRPTIAFVVDLRRDNLLLHLLFKALFHLSPTRIEYLARLLGRRVPAEPGSWKDAPIAQLTEYLDAAPRLSSTELTALRAVVDERIRRFDVELSSDDVQTIDRFHRTFIARGLDLKFNSTGRPPRPSYPSYRELLLERDSKGRQVNYLASSDDYDFVRSLEERDLVVPVVGDLAGPKALAAIGRLLAARGETLSAFYTSNVEFYLLGSGRLGDFVRNLGHIPHGSNAVVIRSIFGGYGAGASYDSAQTQPVDQLLEGFSRGRYRRYADLVSGR